MKYLLAFLLLISMPAYAQEYCSPRLEILNELENYNEEIIIIGLLNNGNIIEILKSDDSFSIIETTPKGITCILSVGSLFEILDKEIPQGQEL